MIENQNNKYFMFQLVFSCMGLKRDYVILETNHHWKNSIISEIDVNDRIISLLRAYLLNEKLDHVSKKTTLFKGEK